MEKVYKLIIASAVLHNILQRRGIALLPEDDQFMHDQVLPAELLLQGHPNNDNNITGVARRNQVVADHF